MKKINAFLPMALVAAFALFSCKSSKEVTDPKGSVSEAPAQGSEIATEEAPGASGTTANDERSFFASIERTPCFGRCPTYSMTIYSDGFVEYNGKRDVEMIGTYTTTITQAQMDAIVARAEEIRFLEMDDKYDGMISDMPSTTTTVMMDGTKKSVYRRYDYPKRILTLEQLFDDLLKSERWISESGEVYPPER